MSEWRLTPANQLRLLGLSIRSTKSLYRYRHGSPLAPRRDTLERAGRLLEIYRSLRLLYPKNPELRKQWFTSANDHFDNRSPLAIAVKYGISGMNKIRSTLAADTDGAAT